MICTLLQKANLLLLDEPTNHLDIYSKEILLQALKEYNGTILFVSHDHNFVNDLSTSILELSNYHVAHYHGNYESYLTQKKEFKQEAQSEKKESTKKESKFNKNEYEQRKMLNRLTAKVDRLEKEIAQLSNKMEKINHQSMQFNKLFQELQNKQSLLEETLIEWDKIAQ